MRRPQSLSFAALVALALALPASVAGCGSKREAVTAAQTQPASIYAGLPLRGTPGERVYEASGCAACHRLGPVGNDGPGPRLTHVGARLGRRALRRTLVDPKAPMPSFRGLAQEQRQPLVTYLSRLR